MIWPFGLVDAVEQFAGLFDAVGGVDDDDGVGFGLEVDDAGAGAEHGFDQFLDLFHVGGAEVAELIVELDAGQLGELGLGEGVDGVALGVEGEAVHEREFLHLLERVAVVEVAGDEEFRAGDFGVVEILAAGGFGEELEDVVEAGVLDDEAFLGFLHFLFVVSASGPKAVAACRESAGGAVAGLAGGGVSTARGAGGGRAGGRGGGRADGWGRGSGGVGVAVGSSVGAVPASSGRLLRREPRPVRSWAVAGVWAWSNPAARRWRRR